MEKLIWALVLGAAFYFAWWTTQRSPQEALLRRSSTQSPPTAAAANAGTLPEKTWPESMPTIKLGDREDNPSCYQDLDFALHKGQQEHKPVIAVFTRKTCGWSQQFQTEICPSGRIQGYHNRFIWAAFDWDAESTRPLVDRFATLQENQSLPIVLYFYSDGRFMGKHSHVTESEFATRLVQALEKNLTSR